MIFLRIMLLGLEMISRNQNKELRTHSQSCSISGQKCGFSVFLSAGFAREKEPFVQSTRS